jgi:tripartite-type tricarboxylate transporter receptor subunit TctC
MENTPMKMRVAPTLARIFALVLAFGTAGAASAQTAADAKWPDKPIHIIVPLPAGSAADVMARLIGQNLSKRLGQPVIIDNRSGASGVIGSDAVAKSAPDGYTLGVATSTTHITAPVLNAKMPYDAAKDFTMIAIVGESPYVLVARPDLPAKTVAEMVALAKAKPGTLSYSSVGNASQARLLGELFSSLTGVKLNHIPYKTSTHAVIDLVEGRIDMQFGIVGSSLALFRQGKLRALATTTARRTQDLPNVPTMAEAGVPGFVSSLMFALVAPAGVPAPIVKRLNHDVVEIMALPEVKRALASQAIEATSSTPEEATERFAKEIGSWKSLAIKAGLRSQ